MSIAALSPAAVRARRKVAVLVVVGAMMVGVAAWQVVARTAQVGTGSSMWTPTTVLSGCASTLHDAGEAFTVFAQGQTIHVVQSVRNTSRIPVVLTSGDDAPTVVFETELDSPGSVDDWTGAEDTLSRVAVPPGREAIAHVTWPADSFQGTSGVTYGIHVVPITVSALGVSRAVEIPLQGGVLVMPGVEAGTDAFRDQLASVCGIGFDPRPSPS